ncbi:MAG: hypothetical protein JKY94_16860 [Rhodobacteraceae bacterium]|nr:hypothetical protein [Paracoccaceae bacterium]
MTEAQPVDMADDPDFSYLLRCWAYNWGDGGARKRLEEKYGIDAVIEALEPYTDRSGK